MEAPHEHCASCVNLRCTTKPVAGASCDLTACPLACGATFHSCKSAEHRLLCPLERVPCLNSGFGCPITLVRQRMASHLEVCPAGLVCCTMEWNRWPVSSLDYTSQLSRCSSSGGGVEEPEQLDMALALQDQRMLLESLKVVAMAPTRWEPAVARTKVRGAVRMDLPESAPEASASSSCESVHRPSPGLAPPLPPGSAKERIANGIDGLTDEHYGRLYEATLETARSLAAALDVFRAANALECGGGAGGQRGESDARGGKLTNGLDVAEEASAVDGEQERCRCHGCLTTSACHLGTQLPGEPSPGTTGSTARRGQDQEDPNTVPPPPQGNPKEPCVAPYDRPHVVPGIAQRAGHVILEDRGLAVLDARGTEHRPNKPPGFRHVVGPLASAAGRRGPLPDRSHPTSPPSLEDRSVDTSDLEQGAVESTGLGEMDPVAAALLFCLEESRECRRISDKVRVDGRRVDVGTQTFTFPAAILVTNTRVGEMASASACDHAAHQLSCPSPLRTLRLGLALESLEVEVPHGRFLPFQPPYQHTFSFLCGQAFRRDQFSWHSANVHADIHAGLSGWMEHRCPLAYYGCTFSQRRLGPAGQEGRGAARVVHDGRLQSFGVRPCPGTPLLHDGPRSDQLTGLPMEILWHIAGFLDSFSLCQMSVVSRGMRDVCSSLLQTRGVVDLQWERRLGPQGTVCWHVKNKVWRFSTAFSAVTKWRFSDLPSMSDHLRECRFNTPEPQTEPVPLPAMCTARDRQSLRRLLRPVTQCHHVTCPSPHAL
ncbi:F-box only protein 30-like [Gadus chalcogrammus]|uniref:F-box only protein 30-like n=1 Tax=Gadus chalcogrammus TaxID=1042646 RepID=UPI0024C4BAE6|nr:F-box only protein 30-like [Gadus chalcogrammus]